MTATAVSPERLAGVLAPVERWLLVVDFDGTLAPIVARPDEATALPGAVEVLAALAARTEVAVVSGRPLDDLRRRLQRLPLTLAGGHGAEILTAGGERHDLVDHAAVGATLERVGAAVGELVREADGWLVEPKRASLAVHHRNVSPVHLDEALAGVRSLLESHRDDPPGFDVLAGKAVLEFRPRGVDKGAALAWIADRTPPLEPLAIGDDVTDEDAFREAAARGGAGILVAPQPRPTAAAWRITGPDDVIALLRTLRNQ